MLFKRKKEVSVERAHTDDGARKGSTKSQQKVQAGINDSLGLGAIVLGQDTVAGAVPTVSGNQDGVAVLGGGAMQDKIKEKRAPTFVGVEQAEAKVTEGGGGLGMKEEVGKIGLAI